MQPRPIVSDIGGCGVPYLDEGMDKYTLLLPPSMDRLGLSNPHFST